MTVEFAGLRLANPVIAASGTFGYGVEFASILDLNELGGLVVKGLSREPMAGNPPPRLVETPSGMLNSIGLQNVGVDAFIREKLPRLQSFRTAVRRFFFLIFSFFTRVAGSSLVQTHLRFAVWIYII